MDRRARRPVGLAMTIRFVIARSGCDEAIHEAFASLYAAQLFPSGSRNL